MFKRSLTIMKISGIPIKLHFSFLLVLPFVALVIGNNIEVIAGIAGIGGEALFLNPYLLGLILAILLFISVVFHELSHSFVVRRRGIEIDNITLMLLGGVAQMQENEEGPKDEVWMAFSGPLFSLVLGFLLLFIWKQMAGIMSADLQIIVYYLGSMNIFLAVFNLLPAFPSDGGRILRSLIARKTSYLRATKIATDIGKVFAIAFGIFGFISGNFIIILIAFFIYIGANQEYQVILTRDIFIDFTVSDLMSTNVSTVREGTSVQDFLDKILREKHSGYPVIDAEGNLTGCVTLGDVKSISSEDQKNKEVGEIMTRELITIGPEKELYHAFKKLSEANIGRLIVVENDNLKGILTRSDIMKAYQLKKIKETRIETNK
ncbi:MAG: CBS domain-containing protein [Bacillota bacterium]